MSAIAARTGQAPGAVITVASGPDWTLPVAFLGILILCLWRGRLRWAGLPMALVVAFWPRPEPPDIWISSDGSAVALRQDRRAIAARPETRRFALDVWSRRRGLEIDDKAGGTLFDCNRRRCLAVGQGEIASWNQSRPPSAESLVELCQAKLVILRSVGPTPCPGRFSLDADDFRAGGSAELYRQGQGWRVVWAQPLRGRRPWTVSDTGG
jgi:competence protein ComEC